MKTLVTYYSRTGTNRTIAENLAEELGADLDEIVDQKNRGGIRGYLGAGAASRGKKLTEITTNLDPGEYDSVLLGSPIWAGNMNPSLRTYLSKFDLKGKKVAFFFVSGSNDPSKAIGELKTIIPWADYDYTLSLSTKEVKEGGYREKVGEFIEAFKASESGIE